MKYSLGISSIGRDKNLCKWLSNSFQCAINHTLSQWKGVWPWQSSNPIPSFYRQGNWHRGLKWDTWGHGSTVKVWNQVSSPKSRVSSVTMLILLHPRDIRNAYGQGVSKAWRSGMLASFQSLIWANGLTWNVLKSQQKKKPLIQPTNKQLQELWRGWELTLKLTQIWPHTLMPMTCSGLTDWLCPRQIYLLSIESLDVMNGIKTDLADFQV